MKNYFKRSKTDLVSSNYAIVKSSTERVQSERVEEQETFN